MKIAEILRSFMIYADMRDLDTTGDVKRFYRAKTARAWTAWLTKARG